MDFSSNEDFFLNLKLPTHLPNEVPKQELPPASLPARPPTSLPSIPRHSISRSQISPKQKSPVKVAKPIELKVGINEDIDLEDEEIEHSQDSKTPIPIPGTSIILSTDEDIAKWIEERKKNWPSKKRMEQKAKEVSLKRLHGDDDNSLANKKLKRYCKFFIRGNCRNDNCLNLHEIPLRALPNNKIVYHHDIAIQIPERYSKSMNSGKSLHNLVMEHDHYKFENVKILQIIEKLFQNHIIKLDYDKYKK